MSPELTDEQLCLYILALELYNHGEYYECHEELEKAWKATPGDHRLFYQGIIQTASTFHHYVRGAYLPALTLLYLAIEKLTPYRGTFLGLNTTALLDELEQWLGKLRECVRLGAEGGPALRIPPIEYDLEQVCKHLASRRAQKSDLAVNSNHPLKIVSAALVIEDRRVLITRRPDDRTLGGLWEFPGGKLKPGESPRQALQREFREELGCDCDVGPICDVLTHRYPEFDVVLLFYDCARRGELQPHPDAVSEWRFARPGELGGFQFVPADQPLIARLLRHVAGEEER
ncbi:MAG: DUF309 domain-containing protein [bacterium]